MQLWLVRHGETIVGEDGLYLPHHGLTELGREQARAVAEVLAQHDFDACYSSSLPRAVETAATFANLTGSKFASISALNEIEVGDLTNAPVEFKQRIINHYGEMDYSMFGGEDAPRFAKRVQKGFAELLEDAEERQAENVVAFLHGGTIAAIIDHLAGEEFDYRVRPRMPNCSYSVATRNGEGIWSSWNGWQTDHLPKLT